MFATALSSHVTAQIRVMSALLQSVKSLTGRTPEELDPYWTLMSYFNSLRELGHAATLIRADITDYLNAMWDRLEIRPDANADPRRFINADRELTSRVQSSEIPEVLQQLFERWDGTKDSHPIDVCLATNMIQVGLDVPRLGLMTVVGQPKTTSEYIQATSRVGRSHPGLVVTVYNPSKPRDRSHFEHFRSYHETIYRWVEPTSVTPFAVPVRDRALHALAVTLVRYFGGDAAREWPQPWKTVEQLVPQVTEVIAARIRAIDPDEEDATRRQLTEIFGDWRRNPPPAMVTSSRPKPTLPSCILRALRSSRNGVSRRIRRRARCAMSIRLAMPACFLNFLSRRMSRCLLINPFAAASSSLHSVSEPWFPFHATKPS